VMPRHRPLGVACRPLDSPALQHASEIVEPETHQTQSIKCTKMIEIYIYIYLFVIRITIEDIIGWFNVGKKQEWHAYTMLISNNVHQERRKWAQKLWWVVWPRKHLVILFLSVKEDKQELGMNDEKIPEMAAAVKHKEWRSTNQCNRGVSIDRVGDLLKLCQVRRRRQQLWPEMMG
jgi:hypothetical protein